MASIRLVVPTWHYWIDPLKLQPLWELHYATVLREAFPEHDVALIDMREENAGLPESDIYVYWINKVADAFEIYQLVAKFKALYPKSLHIAGGTHVDHMPEQCAEHVDVVLKGTAEDTMVQAVTDILERKTPEKFYRSNQSCHFNKYPVIARDFIPAHRVVNDKHFQMNGSVPGTGAYFSRGCSFRCKFCVYNNPPKFEFRTGAQIREEIEYLKREYGIQGINLRDEVCIPVNKKEAVEYLTAIGDSGIILRGQSVPLGSEELVRLSARQASAARLSARAGELLARIEAHAGGPQARRAWNRGLLLASLLLFLSGFAVGFASSSRLFQLLSALAGFLAALVALLLARRGTTIPEVGEKDFILHLKDEYRNFSGGPQELASATLAGIGLELQKQRLEADLLAREAAEKSAAAGKLEARLRTQEAEVRALALDTENADRTVRAWLAERSVAGRDAYLSLRHQRRTRTEQLNDLERQLTKEMERRQTEDPERLRSDCLRRLSELDKEGVPRRGKTELEIRRLETALREQRRQLEARQAEQARLHARQAGARGRISGSLGDLPEQIMQCESELRRTGQQIALREEERQAALLLKDIFAGLAAEAETHLSALQRELASTFSELVPTSREVELQGLDTRSIRAADAGGGSRLLPHLSRGTQDAFLLAARLALARKSSSRPGVLILDEPFFALDTERSERALGLLKGFQADHGWQIVMLSKDQQLYALAQTLFPDGQFNSL